ncbi:hypothetical protein Ga0061062_11282 [Comamonas thiooxydans]|nr:hypothetical protein Ga0061062_11282 [Comamonas thiooxydans]
MHITGMVMGTVTMMGTMGIRTATSIMAIGQVVMEVVMEVGISITAGAGAAGARPETQTKKPPSGDLVYLETV